MKAGRVSGTGDHVAPPRSRKRSALAALVAVRFGVATVVAGSRVLLGADPGYAVFRPLLWCNAAMGVAEPDEPGWAKRPLRP